jgi:hypothetical protein
VHERAVLRGRSPPEPRANFTRPRRPLIGAHSRPSRVHRLAGTCAPLSGSYPFGFWKPILDRQFTQLQRHSRIVPRRPRVRRVCPERAPCDRTSCRPAMRLCPSRIADFAGHRRNKAIEQPAPKPAPKLFQRSRIRGETAPSPSLRGLNCWRPRRDLNPCYRRERPKESRSLTFAVDKTNRFSVRRCPHLTPAPWLSNWLSNKNSSGARTEFVVVSVVPNRFWRYLPPKRTTVLATIGFVVYNHEYRWRPIREMTSAGIDLSWRKAGVAS